MGRYAMSIISSTMIDPSTMLIEVDILPKKDDLYEFSYHESSLRFGFGFDSLDSSGVPVMNFIQTNLSRVQNPSVPNFRIKFLLVETDPILIWS